MRPVTRSVVKMMVSRRPDHLPTTKSRTTAIITGTTAMTVIFTATRTAPPFVATTTPGRARGCRGRDCTPRSSARTVRPVPQKSTSIFQHKSPRLICLRLPPPSFACCAKRWDGTGSTSRLEANMSWAVRLKSTRSWPPPCGVSFGHGGMHKVVAWYA